MVRPIWNLLMLSCLVLAGTSHQAAGDDVAKLAAETTDAAEAPKAVKAEDAKKDTAKPPKKTRTDWASIKIGGSYPEGTQMPGLFGSLSEDLSTCLNRLQAAGKDKSIKGVILHIDSLAIGWGRLHELQTGIAEIRKAGKPVWACMNDSGNKEYLLASSCDRIVMPESGTLMLTGLRAEVTFYKNLLEMLDVKADMLRVGAFKSAAEPYTRSEMSPEFREEMETILDDYYAGMVNQIASSRKLQEDAVRTFVDEGLISAKRAQELGLIDELAYEDQLLSLIAAGDSSLDARIRDDYRKKQVNTELDLFSLMELFAGGTSDTGSTRPRIAVLRLEGPIISGGEGMSFLTEAAISSDKIVPLIHKLSKDNNVKAIVLRVDSPGGSALASDLIWRALEASGKPVVASMGDTAASGGYYISMGAEAIFAEPGTLTGSIGVVGGKIALDGLMKKVGVTTTVISRGKNSGVMSITEGFSDSERKAMQNMLNTIYEQFTQKAAAGRKMEHAKLEAMARGRVYTGRQARELGLVDHLGTLADAIAHARTLVDDKDSKLELEDLPRAQSPLEMLLGQNTPANHSFDVWVSLLPEKSVPALKHLRTLKLIADEPALLLLPFAVELE